MCVSVCVSVCVSPCAVHAHVSQGSHGSGPSPGPSPGCRSHSHSSADAGAGAGAAAAAAAAAAALGSSTGTWVGSKRGSISGSHGVASLRDHRLHVHGRYKGPNAHAVPQPMPFKRMPSVSRQGSDVSVGDSLPPSHPAASGTHSVAVPGGLSDSGGPGSASGMQEVTQGAAAVHTAGGQRPGSSTASSSDKPDEHAGESAGNGGDLLSPTVLERRDAVGVPSTPEPKLRRTPTQHDLKRLGKSVTRFIHARPGSGQRRFSLQLPNSAGHVPEDKPWTPPDHEAVRQHAALRGLLHMLLLMRC